jgi:hypothetical protein
VSFYADRRWSPSHLKLKLASPPVPWTRTTVTSRPRRAMFPPLPPSPIHAGEALADVLPYLSFSVGNTVQNES